MMRYLSPICQDCLYRSCVFIYFLLFRRRWTLAGKVLDQTNIRMEDLRRVLVLRGNTFAGCIFVIGHRSFVLVSLD